MDYATFLPTLALVTLLAVALFALWDKRKTEQRRADPEAPRSTLAEDAPNTATGPAAPKDDAARRDAG
jgi:hypothetical protein